MDTQPTPAPVVYQPQPILPAQQYAAPAMPMTMALADAQLVYIPGPGGQMIAAYAPAPAPIAQGGGVHPVMLNAALAGVAVAGIGVGVYCLAAALEALARLLMSLAAIGAVGVCAVAVAKSGGSSRQSGSGTTINVTGKKARVTIKTGR